MKKTIVLISSICLLSLNNISNSMIKTKEITKEKYPSFYKAYDNAIKSESKKLKTYRKKEFREQFIEHLYKIVKSKNTSELKFKLSLLKYILKNNDILLADTIEKALLRIEAKKLTC